MGVVNAYFIYRFVTMLNSRWIDFPAYKAGIIDQEGNLRIPVARMTLDQKQKYTLFDRLIFNLKRLIEKLPGGKSGLARLAATLYLLKESTNHLYDAKLEGIVKNRIHERYILEEKHWNRVTDLAEGLYEIESISGERCLVEWKKDMQPVAQCLGYDIYKQSGHIFTKDQLIENTE